MAVHWIAVATVEATTAEAGATVVTFFVAEAEAAVAAATAAAVAAAVAAIAGAAVGSGRGFRRRGLGRPWSRWRFCRRE